MLSKKEKQLSKKLLFYSTFYRVYWERSNDLLLLMEPTNVLKIMINEFRNRLSRCHKRFLEFQYLKAPKKYLRAEREMIAEMKYVLKVAYKVLAFYSGNKKGMTLSVIDNYLKAQKGRSGQNQLKERAKVTPKIRFRIFKRDKFTCQYCGRKPPKVELEIDHKQPVSKGGISTEENLITSCFECNIGKGNLPL